MPADASIASRGFRLAFLVLLPLPCCNSVLSPIMIVNGILGSQLEAKLNKEFSPEWWCDADSDWYTLWVSLQQLSPFVVDCWANNTRMLFKNGEYFNSEGVEIRTPGFGETGSVEYLDSYGYLIPYYHHLVDFFVTKHGYVRGVSIRAAPYDWRLSPDLLEKECYYDNVQQLIETMYNDNGNTSVTIVTHSMGSPVILYFLTHIVSQQWKDKYLKAFVSLSGVWKGSVSTLISIVTGDSKGAPMTLSTARYVQRNTPSIYFLLPIPDHNIWSNTDPVVMAPDKNYTVYDYAKLFNDLQYSMGHTQYKAVPSFLKTLPPPNVDTYCYYGTNVPTPAVLVYEEDEFPDNFPSFIMGDGDGLVNDVSLQACSVWKRAQSRKVSIGSFPGVNHLDMVKDRTVLQEILNIVSSNPADHLY